MAGSTGLPCWYRKSKHSLRVPGQVVLQEARMPRPAEIRPAIAWSRSNHLSLVKRGSRLRPPHSHAHKRFNSARQAPSPLAQLAEAAVEMVQAWYMDESTADPRMPHRAHPDRPVGLEQLRTLGVLYWKVWVRAGAPRPCACSARPLPPSISFNYGVLGLLSSRHASALTASVCKRNNATCQSRGSVRGNAVPTQEGRRHPGRANLSALVWSN